MRIIIAGIVCLLASSLSAFDLIDTVQSLRQQAWESEYIPESTVEVIPLTEYDEFEVVELFRVETIEELEASIIDGYPFAWLEETLKDESIPWEDRYWLNCRMRGLIAENLHTFFREDGSAHTIPCDWMKAGENYWREVFIVNPIGEAPEILELDMPRAYRESGYLVNLFGVRIGSIAIADSLVRLSRDGRVGIYQTGWRNEYNWSEEFYFCFLYADGSFTEIPVEEAFYSKGSQYNISQDGSLAVFTASDHGHGERSRAAGWSDGDPSSERPLENRLYLFNENAQETAQYKIEGILAPRTYPVISPDNTHIGLCLYIGYNGGQLLETRTGNVLYRSPMAVRFPSFSQNSGRVAFSGQKVPITVFNTSNSRISNEYPFSLFCTTGLDLGLNDFLLGTSICNNEKLILGIYTNRHSDVEGVELAYSESIIKEWSGYNSAYLSPNGHFAWLSEVLEGQGTTRSPYGNKGLVLQLEEVN